VAPPIAKIVGSYSDVSADLVALTIHPVNSARPQAFGAEAWFDGVDEPEYEIDGGRKCKDVEGWIRGGGAGLNAPKRMVLECRLTDKFAVNWDMVLVDSKKLFVPIPEQFLTNGSRDSLVSLLDHAEEKLKCSQVIVYLRKDRKDLGAVMKLFMYLGFAVLDPGPHPLLPFVPSDDQVYLAYQIDEEDEDEDDDY
jgi:hypothetical protein